MENMTLLEKFAIPDLLKKLTLGEKIFGSIQVSILGMAVTFIALILLMFLVMIMSKIIHRSKFNKNEEEEIIEEDLQIQDVMLDDHFDELLAVMTAAVASLLNTSTQNFVVKNIVRVDDHLPIWSKTGINDQMNTRL
jgi:sodium pump decarboxylase gamma subunit